MAADQQFCLRWNNHQSTLVSVFDSLLEKGALVDCTIAAEGQSMKAHKVVLSACSSYFETLLSEHYEKHPIIILKDVKYQELRALMDYMYRGEVNILQDQLASLLKVAESLQIKGLSDSGGGDEKETAQERPDSKKQSAPRPQPISRTKSDTENRRPSSGYSDPNEFPVASPPATPKASRNECSSPIARKRKKVPENSMNDLDTSSGLDGYDNSSSNELPPQKHPVPKTPVKLPLPKIKPPVPVQPVIEKSVPSIFTPVESPRPKPTPPPPPSVPVEQDVKPKVEPTSEVYIQPKTEFVEEEEEIEDLTLDDEEDYDMSDQAMAGPSHGGDGSNQGFLQWQDQSQDEMFNAAQEAIGGQKDSQEDIKKHDNDEEINTVSVSIQDRLPAQRMSLREKPTVHKMNKLQTTMDTTTKKRSADVDKKGKSKSKLHHCTYKIDDVVKCGTSKCTKKQRRINMKSLEYSLRDIVPAIADQEKNTKVIVQEAVNYIHELESIDRQKTLELSKLRIIQFNLRSQLSDLQQSYC